MIFLLSKDETTLLHLPSKSEDRREELYSIHSGSSLHPLFSTEVPLFSLYENKGFEGRKKTCSGKDEIEKEGSNNNKNSV